MMQTFRITGRLKARGLTADSGAPFHIGDPDQFREYIDRPLWLDEDDLPVLTGSSICGVMASLARTVLRLKGCPKGSEENDPSFIALFGSSRGSDQGQASRLAVRDGQTSGNAGGHILVRDRNGVNRERGSADDKRLFHEQVVDGEWSFDLDLEYQETGPRTENERRLLTANDDPDLMGRLLLWDVLKMLCSGWTTIGGQAGIGYGRVILEDCRFAIYDRSSPQAVFDYALNRWDSFSQNGFPAVIPDVDLPSGTTDGSLQLERIRFCCRLQPLEPLLVKAGYTNETYNYTGAQRGNNLNLAPWRADNQGPFSVDTGFCLNSADKPYIPGSSLRGSLRSYVERIIRTLAGDDRAWNLEQAQAHGQEFSRRHEYIENDVNCLVSRVFGFSGLGGRITFSDAVPVNVQIFENRRKLLDHVALDRFTGGAADQAKFNSRPYFPLGPALPDELDGNGDLVCEIELFDFDDWHLGLVLMMLRDMRLGRIYLGHGKNKGFGKVRLEGATIAALTVGFNPTELKKLSIPAGFRGNGLLETPAAPGLTARFDSAVVAWRGQLASVCLTPGITPGGAS
ncbi:MAG: hypothetical protein HQK55_05575 [Deltaproteobacteria bacterium]|nr:hypothetical protein [Deltaproteobacteria bacterium]